MLFAQSTPCHGDVLEGNGGLPGGFVDLFLVGTGFPQIVPTEMLQREGRDICYLFIRKFSLLEMFPVYIGGMQAGITCRLSTDEDHKPYQYTK